MISVVIPVHNRKAFTEQCLACLSTQTYRNFQAIVVDDGSSDGTAEMIQEKFSETIVLTGDGSLWWTEATNWGIRYSLQHQDRSEANFVLTLNDDTKMEPDYLQSLLNAYDRFQPCLVGSVSVNSDEPNKLEFCGTVCELYLAGGRHMAEDYNFDYQELVRRTDHVVSDSLPGRGTLIPMEVFEKIGLFDSKKYIHYMSDIDFSVRAKKAGYPLIVDVKSVVQEFVSASGIQVERMITTKQFIESFTSIKSPTNLKVRYNFAIDHSKTKLVYFCFDVGRICAGFFLRKMRLMKPL